MVKKAWVLGIIFFLMAGNTIKVQAQEEKIIMEQIQTKLPEVRIYAYEPENSEHDTKPASAEAMLNADDLEFVSAKPVNAANPPTDYYFLVDCSTSTSVYQMDAVKEVVGEFAGNMRENESLTLLAFGVEVEILLKREKDPDVIKEAVQSLLPDKEGTVFLDAIAAAAELSDREEDALNRKIAFVFSDSVDVNKGGYTKEEIGKLLGSGTLPYYAFGFDSGTKEGLDNFGAVARQSGGAITIVSADNLREEFDRVRQKLEDGVEYIFRADNNIIDKNDAVVSLLPGEGREKTEKNVILKYWEKDESIPGIKSAIQTTEQTIEVTFTEKVRGAEIKENYTIKGTDENLLGIQAVSYDEDTSCARISMTDKVNQGEVEISVSGITDISMEKNKVAEGTKIMLEGGGEEPDAEEQTKTDLNAAQQGTDEGGMESAAWFVLTIVSVAAIAGITIGVIKKRGGLVIHEGKLHFGGDVKVIQESLPQEQVKIHVSETISPVIRLYVSVSGRESKELKIPVNGAVFVGRSEICEVYFDDQGMSRQHFVIEKKSDGYLLTNLSDTNGTILNGVKLGNPRMLRDGDRIEAGAESFLFYQGEA